jgi:hypothetical protein
MSFLINPFAFLAAGGDFEPIATVTVGSGGAANIEFTSIPGTYQHLQLRIISKSTSTEDNGDMIFNGVTTNSYAWHSLYGDGSSAAADASSSRANIVGLRLAGSTATSVFSGNLVDILDYANTSKNTTVRIFKGQDNNGSGVVFLDSGLYAATSAITSIKFTARSHNFAQHSTAALYGIKA